MSNRSNSEQSKTVVDAYYQAGVEGRLREFARYLHPDFTTTAPKPLTPRSDFRSSSLTCWPLLRATSCG